MAAAEAIGLLLGVGAGAVYAAFAVFTRVAAAAMLLPGFGEQAVPTRVKLGAALAFSAVVWPAAQPALPPPPETAASLGLLLLSEAVAGLLIGLSVRLLVMALQFAGAIAAQSTSIAQIFGPGVTPDPLPALGNILVIAGIALAMAAGLHVKAAAAIAGSYVVLPPGIFPDGGDVAAWGAGRAMEAFALAFSLAAPFVIASFAYNVALGAINRAMPQLMVAFIGAPAITGFAILLLFLGAPLLLQVWLGRLDLALSDPLGPAR